LTSFVDLCIIYIHFWGRSNLKEILPPTHCPGCNSELVWVNDLLYCRNSDCADKSRKIISHFASSLKIKGLGPATIASLELSDISDIYELDRDYVVSKLNSVTLADKLLDQIEKSKSAGLSILLGSFSIPLFGKTASEKLCSQISNITEVTEQKLLEAGLGAKTILNFMHWFNTEYAYKYKNLPFEWKTTQEEITSGPVVVITGKLFSFKTKEIAKGVLQQKGYVVKTSITRDTEYLVNESNIASAKTKKAEAMGIIIISDIKELLEI
jgi:DNA ligase (NAD+)